VTAPRDNVAACLALRLRLKDILRGQFVSTLQIERQPSTYDAPKIHAIMVYKLYSTTPRRDALLDIVFEEVSTAADLAVEIMRILAKFEISIHSRNEHRWRQRQFQ
jgi:hypothetical protein